MGCSKEPDPERAPHDPADSKELYTQTAKPENASEKVKELEAKGKFESVSSMKLKGDVELKQSAEGVSIVVEVKNAPTGKKGIHIHEKGDCSDITGESMGSHFAPTVKTHGLPSAEERHLGDLGNIEIDVDGKGRLEFFAKDANLRENDPLSFLKRAIVIHEFEDKGMQPTGGAGSPIACAVIEKN